jgi:hypothetical protein
MRSRVPIDDRPQDDGHDNRRNWTEGRDKRERLEMAREAGWGHVSWLSVVSGTLTALGAFAVVVGIAAALLEALGLSLDGLSDSDWRSLGLATGLAGAAALFGAFALGGYVAGRMARRAGMRHGLLVFVAGAVLLVAAAAITGLEGGLSAIRDRVESLGAPTGDSLWTGVGVLTGTVALVGTLLGSVLGALRGERWHQRLVARALDPDIGPDADLRADVEAQRTAAAQALARARQAGVLPQKADEQGDDDATSDGDPTRRGAEPTAAGPPKSPSSWSSGP